MIEKNLKLRKIKKNEIKEYINFHISFNYIYLI